MSSNPFERGHAAHPGPVRPAFERADTSPGSLHSGRAKWSPPQTAQKKSVSLLGQALACRNQEQTSVNPNAVDFPSRTFQSPPPVQLQGVRPQDCLKSAPNRPSAYNMALVAPAIPSDMNIASSPGSAESECHSLIFSNVLFTDNRHFINKAGGRGTSLERTPKEKRVQELPKGKYSTNPGDTGINAAPASIFFSASTSISNNPPTEGVRAEYRSWRDARQIMAEKAWSIGKQGGGDNQDGSVEKSVKESLAGVEHNARSRKASHSLGFFREGLPEDRTKKRDNKHNGRLKDAFSQSRDYSDREENRDVGQESTPSSEVGQPQSTKFPSCGRSPLASPREGNRKCRTGYTDTMAPQLEEGYFDGRPQETEVVSEDAVRTLPPQLLADIRKHHNLTPGAAKGSSFSSSLPVTESERLKADNAEEPLNSPEAVHIGSKLKNEEPTPPLNAEDEDDSGEEQISSALFVPHQSSHDTSERPSRDSGAHGRSKLDDQKYDDKADSQQWLEEHQVPSDEVDMKYVNSENQSRPLPSPALDAKEVFSAERDPLLHNISSGPHGEGGYGTQGEESGVNDDETTPTASLRNGHMIPDSFIHDHQQKAKRPLEAIELIPYRHQVGGHTNMWRFSKRAVCKQLNNRENEFYERVEHYHPRLLDFLPRYIGVLNVTFEKQVRRKSTRKEKQDVAAELKGHSQNGMSEQSIDKDNPATNGHTFRDDTFSTTRMISQSLQPSSSASFPTVTFADNRHIIPSSFLQSPPQIQHRSQSDSSAVSALTEHKQSQAPLPDKDFTFRPSLSDKHAVSWGATTVNKTLRNEVFGEAFLQQPIPIHRHRKPASQNRSLPNRRGPPALRASNSETSLKPPQMNSPPSTATPQLTEESIRRKALKTAAAQRDGWKALTPAAQVSQEETSKSDIDDAEFGEKVGTSAPEPEIARSQVVSSGRRQRRYSSGGLRRKPSEVADDRGNLKYFEEADDAGYKGDTEDVFTMDHESSNGKDHGQPDTKYQESNPSTAKDPLARASKSEADKHFTERVAPPARNGTLDFMGLPRPVNPKEAQTQTDSRVQFFLLLEDLTAGMRRPCIMDLKMGTRQYGVDANDKKQKSQQQKCAETTSRELGVRVCGLQVWDVKSQSYHFQDKYFGRELKAGREFQNALKRFLYDGVDYASVLRHIPTILRRLSELEVLIRSLVGYRFYAASLLMFYDGEADGEDESDSAATEKSVNTIKEIDFKIADFANCITREGFNSTSRPCPPKHPDLPDKGFLRGLRSLKRYFVAIQNELHGAEMGRMKNGDTSPGLDGADQSDEGDMSY